MDSSPPKKVGKICEPKLIVQGRYLCVEGGFKRTGNTSPPTRGKVGVFSKSSQRRMRDCVAKLGEAIPIFVTLTYGKEWSENWRDWKRDLDVFLKRLKRYNPNLSAIWKLEPQKRMAPHFHLLVYGGRINRDWLALNWAQSTGDVSIEHIKAGTEVRKVKTVRGVAHYASKYMAKEVIAELPEYWLQVGQWWGKFNKNKLPYAEEEEIPIPKAIAEVIPNFLREKFFWARIEKTKSDLIKDGYPEIRAESLAFEKTEPLSKHCYPTTTRINSVETFLRELKDWIDEQIQQRSVKILPSGIKIDHHFKQSAEKLFELPRIQSLAT